MNKPKLWLVIVITLMSYDTACADIYKWVDRNGVVQFGDAPPEDAEASKQTLTPLNRYQGPARPPVEEQAQPTAATATGDVAVTKSPQADSAKIRCNKSDRNDCFDEAEDRLCLLRYSLRCGDLVYWKTLAKEVCEQQRRPDCGNPARILRERPLGMLLRDLDAPLPLKGFVSRRDFDCLSKSGFFCHELSDEASCRKDYGMSCAELSVWAENLPEQCHKQHNDWCDDSVRLYHEYRPRSIEEVQRRGTRNQRGGNVIRDRLFIELDIRDGDDSRRQELTDILARLPGT